MGGNIELDIKEISYAAVITQKRWALIEPK